MAKLSFEWDDKKEQENLRKHGISFELAQEAFFDERRLIARDNLHSEIEPRYYCFGNVGGQIVTVRFTLRGRVIRIIGAGIGEKERSMIPPPRSRGESDVGSEGV